ncbi:MAG: ornithine carbamoyltransferase [Spirochaetes bacterium]|nr:MAG: ornithine carbamoyltransferase [Spirochaetota bacterium]
MAHKDLLSVKDLSAKEIIALFDFAAKLKKAQKTGKPHRLLEGKSLAMIFEKTSTRTRVSFEIGMYQLGGYALFLSHNDIQLGRGESVADTARVLARYADGIMIRTFSHGKVIELARIADIPVINGLSDLFHPCQALSDLFTIYEREPGFAGRKLAYVGDGNNVAHSLMLCAAILGMDIAVASPKDYQPDREVVSIAFGLCSKSGSHVTVTSDIGMAVENADYLYTDVWTSMGQEREAARRRKAFRDYKITRKLLDKCADGCRVMHCLPAHRGEEIEEEVLDSEVSIVFDQAENRLHVQKALLCALMGK